MELKAYVKSLTDEVARAAFAQRCGTTVGHLKNVMYGYKPCAADLAVAIERESGRRVKRQELRPVDWPKFWPELKAPKQRQVA